MPKLLDPINPYVKCPDGKERAFYQYKRQVEGSPLIRGYVQVKEPFTDNKVLAVPGWVDEKALDRFYVSPTSERAHIFDRARNPIAWSPVTADDLALLVDSSQPSENSED